VFTWTEDKNKLNKKKHGSFLSDIVDVFDDPHLLEFYDAGHSSVDETATSIWGVSMIHLFFL
jgi:uncharacterized DUF497 family protein